MAGSAKIGALFVSLGLDTAQFITGLKKSQGELSSFASMTKGLGAGLAAAAAAAAAGIAYAVKQSADHADTLSKTAQSAGVTVEALSRLEWGAKLSDVSLEQLSGGLGKLCKNLVDVASGGGDKARTAFSALGIEVTDAYGKIRASDAVMADVAEAFSRLEDGTTKTALSMILFGKTGADLIPLLNEGKTGLAEFGAESDRMGRTITTGAAEAAERFNDNMGRLDGVVEGFSVRLMTEVVPSLASMTDTLADPDTQTALVNIANLFIDTANAMAQVVTAAKDVGDWFNWIGSHDIFGNALEPSDWDKATGQFKAMKTLASELKAGDTGLSGFDMSAFYGGKNTTTPTVAPLNVDGLLAGSGSGGGSGLADEAARVFEATRTEAEKFAAEMDRLNRMYDVGAISGDTYNRAVIQAQDAFAQAEGGAADYGLTLQTLDYTQGLVTDGLTAINDAIWDGTDVWGAFAQAGIDALQDISRELVSSGISDFFGNLKNSFGNDSQTIDLMGGDGGSNILSGVADFVGSLFGFADGGSGVVGGSGGVDSQVFMARATPGEPFAFGDDALNGIGGGGQVINVTISSPVDARGSTMDPAEFKRILDQRDQNLLAQVPAALAEAQLHRTM